MADINVEFSTPEIDINLSGGFTIDSTARTLAQDADDRATAAEAAATAAAGSATAAAESAEEAAESAEAAETASAAALNNIAYTYSTTTVYAVNALVIKDGVLYRCIKPVDPAGEFDSSYWEAFKAADGIRTNLAKATANINAVNMALGLEAANWESGSYQTLASGSSLDLSAPSYNSAYMCAKMACEKGDVITGAVDAGTGTQRVWGFYTSEGVSLGRGGANVLGEFTVTAPANAAWIVINSRKRYANAWAVKSYYSIPDKIEGVSADIEDITGVEKYDGWSANGTGCQTEEPVELTITSNSALHAQIIPCEEGDVFSYYGRGVSSSNWRTLCFVDSEGSILWSKSVEAVEYGEVVAPAGTTHLICNFSYGTQGQYIYKGRLLENRFAELENFESESLTYHGYGIRMYGMGTVVDTIVNSGSYTNNGITYTYLGGDKYKIKLSLSGTAEPSYSYINLVAGSRFSVGEKVWVRIEKEEENKNVYIRSTGSEVNYTSSAYETATGNGNLRLLVKQGTTLDNYIVTCAIQSAPSNEELKDMVGNEEKADQDAIPPYYEENDYLTNKINGVLARSYTAGDSFVFITDFHVHKNAGYSLPIISRIYKEAGISKVFFGGDIGTSTGIKGTKVNAGAMKAFWETTPSFYAVAGNHEWKVEDSSYPTATYDYVYNYYISQMEARSSHMSAFGDFWIDSKVAKIRYFFLNQTILTMITDPTLKWFMQELPQVPAGYGIVVVMHHAYHSKTYNTVGSRKYFGFLDWYDNSVGRRNLTVRRISQLLYAVKTRTAVKYALRPYTDSTPIEDQVTPKDNTTAEKNACGDYDPLLSTFAEGTDTGAYTEIVSFDGAGMNTGVYPIAIICGHKHEDAAYDPASATSFNDMVDENTVYLLNGTWYRYDADETSETYGQRVAMLPARGAENLSQTETVPPILVILTTTDCWALNHPDIDPTVRQKGTISEQAFEVAQIDTNAKKMYYTRIGAGNDRTFSF